MTIKDAQRTVSALGMKKQARSLCTLFGAIHLESDGLFKFCKFTSMSLLFHAFYTQHLVPNVWYFII